MFDRRLMLLCTESKKDIFGNIRTLCFPSPNNSVKKDPPLSRFPRQTGEFWVLQTVFQTNSAAM